MLVIYYLSLSLDLSILARYLDDINFFLYAFKICEWIWLICHRSKEFILAYNMLATKQLKGCSIAYLVIMWMISQLS